MGRLIIDGNSVFEIDEECIKRRKPMADCDVEKYFLSEDTSDDFSLGQTDELGTKKKRW